MEEKEKLNLQEKYNFSDDLIDKIEHSIDVIRKAEPLALQFYDEGFYLCFSGGKIVNACIMWLYWLVSSLKRT